MNDKPLIKAFLDKGRFYIYTPYSNNILNVTEECYKEVKKMEYLGISEYCSKSNHSQEYQTILSLLNSGFITGTFIKEIKHIATDDYSTLIDRGLSKLVLQTTQRCNFACRYCHNIHSKSARHINGKADMSWDIAKRSIDFLIEHSQDSEAIDIYFYGGEPLLNFNLIKQVVEYVEVHVNLKPITYHITTNGSLLSDEISNFLVNYKFKIALSIDGNEERQNWTRKYSNGDNTFEIVWNNIKRLLSLCKENYENIMFLPVVFADESKQNTLDFFLSNGITRDRILFLDANVSGIDYVQGTIQKNVTKNGEIKVGYSSDDIYLNIKDNEMDFFLEKYYDKHAIGEIWHHDGTCIPGYFKLFVNAIGDFYSCENAPECHNACIGNIYTGIDINRAISLLNIGKVSNEECIHCWAIRFCRMCSLFCIDEENYCISKDIKKLNCEAYKRRVLTMFRKYIDSVKGDQL